MALKHGTIIIDVLKHGSTTIETLKHGNTVVFESWTLVGDEYYIPETPDELISLWEQDNYGYEYEYSIPINLPAGTIPSQYRISGEVQVVKLNDETYYELFSNFNNVVFNQAADIHNYTSTAAGNMASDYLTVSNFYDGQNLVLRFTTNVQNGANGYALMLAITKLEVKYTSLCTITFAGTNCYWSNTSAVAEIGDTITISGTVVTCFKNGATKWSAHVFANADDNEYTYTTPTISNSSFTVSSTDVTITASSTKQEKNIIKLLTTPAGIGAKWANDTTLEPVSYIPYQSGDSLITNNASGTVTLERNSQTILSATPILVTSNYYYVALSSDDITISDNIQTLTNQGHISITALYLAEICNGTSTKVEFVCNGASTKQASICDGVSTKTTSECCNNNSIGVIQNGGNFGEETFTG